MCRRKGGGLGSSEIFLEDAEGDSEKGDGESPFSPKGNFFPKGPGKNIPLFSNYIQVSHKRQCVKKGKKFSKF
jgi:hypothetical protein